jgi:hypothetical protein
MGRLTGLLLMVALTYAPTSLAATEHAASGPSLAVFQFKGVTAGESFDPSAMGSCEPPDKDGEVSCRPRDQSVAGIKQTPTDDDDPLSPPSVSMWFYNNKLTYVSIVFGGGHFSTIETAFTQQYGKPCSIAHPKWHDVGGGTLDNTVLTWCFSSGKLTLSARGDDLDDQGDAIYQDEVNGPKSAPGKG